MTKVEKLQKIQRLQALYDSFRGYPATQATIRKEIRKLKEK